MSGLARKYIGLIEKQLEKACGRMRLPYTTRSKKVQLNGTRLLIRPAVPSDTDNLFQMHQRLSRETLYFRYLTLHTPTKKEMEAVCNLCDIQGAAYVAQLCNPDSTIIGLAYYCFDPSHPDGSPDLAIIIEDHFQNQGIGKALLKHLFRDAAARGIKTLLASIHPHNNRIRHLLYRTAYLFDERSDSSTLKATINLQETRAPVRKHFINHDFPANLFADLDLGLN